MMMYEDVKAFAAVMLYVTESVNESIMFRAPF